MSDLANIRVIRGGLKGERIQGGRGNPSNLNKYLRYLGYDQTGIYCIPYRPKQSQPKFPLDLFFRRFKFSSVLEILVTWDQRIIWAEKKFRPFS